MIPTQDVTLFDEDGIPIDNSNPLSTLLTDGTSNVTITSNKLDTNAYQAGTWTFDAVFSATSAVTVAQTSGTNLHTVVDNFPVSQTSTISNFPSSFAINNLPITQTSLVSNFPEMQNIQGNTTSYVSNFPSGFNVNNLPSIQTSYINNFPANQVINGDVTSIVISSALPIGAATLAQQITENTSLITIDSDLITFKNNNHLDSLTINTSIVLVDTDLNLFKNENHIDQVTANTSLINIYTRQNNKTQYTRLTDSTSDVDVDSRLVTAKGLDVLPLGEYRTTLPTLTNGQVAPLQVDATGKLLTSTVNPSRKTIELNVTGNYGLLVASMWRNYLSYTIPAGYRYELIAYSSSCANTGGSSRINKVINLGDYNIGTNTFTNGSAYTVPEFCAGIDAEITTVLSATPVTLTITYTNQAGVAGRTGTIGPITASSAVGTRFAMTLQAGDYGITNVTAVARSAAPTGVVRLYGLTNLFYHKNDNAEYTYITTTARESLILNAGDIVQLDIFNTVVGAQIVVNKAVGILTPT